MTLPPAAPRPAKILVVDDVAANVMLLSKMVRVMGHGSVSAADGSQAIVTAKAERPDLILMDVMMPVLDGIEATRALKSDPETRLIPIVMVTALSDAKARQSAVDAGADDFLTKPVDALELRLRLKAFLSVKRTYDELETARAKAAEADRQKTEFLASISHEIRTPLTAIASSARILVKHGREKPEAIEKFGTMILDQCGRLTRMLEDVLQLSRLDAGGVEWRDETFPLGELIVATGEMFRPMAEEKGIQLGVQVRPGGPGDGLVRSDRDRLTQVVVNLVSNALKFTPAGGTVRIVCARVGTEDAVKWGVSPPAGRGAALFAVEDSGAGIAPEHQAIVFEKYRQVTDPTSGKPAGAGLGLSICKEIVERHGGRIHLRSEPGKGSRFTVALPEAPETPA